MDSSAENREIESAKLVDRIRSENESDAEAAAEELVKRFHRGVIHVIRQNGAPELAEDLAQETFIITLTKILGGQLREPGKLSSFITHTARNLAIAQTRQKTRHSGVYIDELDQVASDSALDPFDQLLLKERTELVIRAIDGLKKDRDRTILTRFYIDGATKSEMIEEMNLGPKDFDRVLDRARQRLIRFFSRLWNNSSGKNNPIDD